MELLSVEQRSIRDEDTGEEVTDMTELISRWLINGERYAMRTRMPIELPDDFAVDIGEFLRARALSLSSRFTQEE